MRLRAERDRGFTLIELLVVIIIIGILTAIAIPVFLAQRRKGYRSAAISDMRNAALAVETYATDHEGLYSGVNNATEASLTLSLEGYNASPWSDFVIYASDTSYCMRGRHRNLSGLEVVFRSDLGFVEVGTPGEFPCDPVP